MLYVGISLSAFRRLAQHRKSPWSSEITRVEIEYLPTRDAALRSEICAIQTERPRYNTIHAANDNAPKSLPVLKCDTKYVKSPPKAAAGDNLLRGYREVHAFLGYDFGEEVEPDYVLIRANGRVQANYWSQERLEKIVTEKGREPYQGVTFY